MRDMLPIIGMLKLKIFETIRIHNNIIANVFLFNLNLWMKKKDRQSIIEDKNNIRINQKPPNNCSVVLIVRVVFRKFFIKSQLVYKCETFPLKPYKSLYIYMIKDIMK